MFPTSSATGVSMGVDVIASVIVVIESSSFVEPSAIMRNFSEERKLENKIFGGGLASLGGHRA